MTTDRVAQYEPATNASHRLVLAAACVLLFPGAVVVGVSVTRFASAPTGTLAPTNSIAVGQCVIVRMGFAASTVGCDEPNDGRIERIIARNESCNPDERRADATDGSRATCLSAD